MSASGALSLAAVVVAVAAMFVALWYVWKCAGELGTARVRLAEGRNLLAMALAAEQSAVKCAEVGAFDQAQRDEILTFLGDTEQ